MKEKNQALAETKNQLAKYINKVAPLIMERLKQPIRFKTDGKPHKKDLLELAAIVNDNNTNKLRVFIDYGYYSICLKADKFYQYSAAYRQDGHEGAYEKEYVYLWDRQENKAFDFTPLKMTSGATLKSKRLKLDKLEEQYQDIGYRISRLKRELSK